MKTKRKLEESDDDVVPEAVKEEERVVEELQMAEWQQGYADTDENMMVEAEPKSKSKPRARKQQKTESKADESKVEAAASTVSHIPRRQAAAKANKKMSGQRY